MAVEDDRSRGSGDVAGNRTHIYTYQALNVCTLHCELDEVPTHVSTGRST